MIDGTYQISIQVGRSTHRGAAVLATSGDVLTANITVDGLGSLRRQGTCTGDEFALSGTINMFLFGRITYRIDGLVAADQLKATCATNKGTYDIVGKRLV